MATSTCSSNSAAATPGDRFKNALYLNPGHDASPARGTIGSRQLIGKKTNRAAIGARIKAVTLPTTLDASSPRHQRLDLRRQPLQQTLGLAKASKIATLEIYWPTSKTTQVFRDVPVDQAIEITEFATEYRKLPWTKVAGAQ